jgi:hypothetical protein
MRLKFRRASDLCRPTVYKQLDAGNEAAVVRGEENGGLANFVCFTDASHGDAADNPFFYFFVHKHIQTGRLNNAGAHHAIRIFRGLRSTIQLRAKERTAALVAS